MKFDPTAAYLYTNSSGVSSDSTGDDSGSSETAVGLGVGLGVGVPLAAAVAGAIWLFSWKARRKEHLQRGETIDSPYAGGTGQPGTPAPPDGGMSSVQGYAQQQQQHAYQIGQAGVDGLPKYREYGELSPNSVQSHSSPTELLSTPRTELLS